MVRKLVLTFIAVIGVFAMSEAQTRRVSGTVYAPDGAPAVGVSVLVEGTTQGTTTDVTGGYALTNVPADANLQFIFVGMQTQTVPVAGKTTIDVHMQDDSQSIDDVIVVAYGTARKESFTGSAAVIKQENLEKRVVSNVSKALEGQVAGLQATSGTGQPGEGASIQLRGFGSINASSTPLYVVDGVAYGGVINAINPEDIESITVLKDASAGALYGARGANGVIVITTKKGREGSIDVDFKATVGVTQRSIPNYDLVNQREFIELSWQSLYNSAYFTGGYTDPEARAYASSRLAGNLGPDYNPFKNYTWETVVDPATGKVRTDAVSAYNESWIDEVLDNAAIRQEYQASVSGGNSVHRGSMSLSFLDEDGILKTTGFQRYTGRVSYDTTPKHWFAGGMSANFAHTKSNMSQYSGSSTSNVFYTAQLMAPIYPVYLKDAEGNDVLDAKGQRQYDFGETGRPQDKNGNCIAGFYEDPYFNMTENLSARTYLTFGSDDEKAGALQGLKATLNFGVDYRTSLSTQYMNPYFGNQASNGGLIYKWNYRYMTYTFNQLVTYNRTFNKHAVSALLGHEFYSYDYNYLEAGRTGVVPGIMEVVGVDMNTAESSSTAHRIESYFARVNYGYDDKYYLDASWRTDGSSRFAPDTRWGNFWSVGASWRLSQEKFLEGADWLDNLTYKISYGVQGNEEIGSYYGWQGYYSAYSTGSSIGYSAAQMENPNLRWEKNGNLNTGIEAAFFGNRLNVSIEYYTRKTTDMLLERPMAFSTGWSSYLDNVGSMRNTGLEFSLNGVIFNRPDLRWDVTFMGATQKNKVLYLTPETPEITGTYLVREGLPIYTYYLPKFAGVDPASGVALYYAYDSVDENGNPVNEYITSNTTKASSSRYCMGTRTPDLFGSIGTNFYWKGLDFSILTTYSIGGKALDGTYSSLMQPFYYGNTYHKHLLRAWQKPGDITDVPRMEVGQSQITSDRFLVDASYFAIKNITLGYTLPKKTCNTIGMKSIRVYVSLDNLALFTHMQGMNPTYSVSGSTGAYTYIPTRSFVGGVDIKF